MASLLASLGLSEEVRAESEAPEPRRSTCHVSKLGTRTDHFRDYFDHPQFARTRMRDSPFEDLEFCPASFTHSPSAAKDTMPAFAGKPFTGNSVSHSLVWKRPVAHTQPADDGEFRRKKLKLSDLPVSAAKRSAIDGLLLTFKKSGEFDKFRKGIFGQFDSSVCTWSTWTLHGDTIRY